MNVGSLFSGVGGLDLGLHQAGHRHVFFCESDPYRRDVLAALWPGVPVYDDVRDVHRERLVGGGGPITAAAGGSGQSQHDADDCDARWPGVPVYDDIRSLGEPAGRAVADGRGAPVDLGWWEAGTGLLCGGFPCQDVSVAGRRAGLAGERSGLFHEFARIIDTVRPEWVLVENVPGLLSSNGGRDFGVVLGTLADLGYGVAWRILDSRFFGVPQRRRRVFIVGALAGNDPRAAAERAGAILAVGSRCVRHPATRGEARPDVAYALADGSGKRTGSGRDGQDTLIAAPLTKGSATGDGVNQPGRRQEDDVNIIAFDWQAGAPQSDNDQSGGKGRKWIVRAGDYTGAIGETRRDAIGGPGVGVRRLTPTECERLQGFPDGWTDLGGTPDSRRYSALGDAVTVNVAEWIGRRLAA